MTFHYSAAINLADPRNGLGTITIETAGKDPIVVNISTLTASPVTGSGTVTIFNHGDFGLGTCVGEDRSASTQMARKFSSLCLAAKVLQGIQGAGIAAGWGTDLDDFDFDFSPSTLDYEISFDADIEVTFGNAATAALFGFANLNYSGESEYFSDITPWGIIVPVLTAVSSPTPNFEPDSIASQAVSASGDVTGLTRAISPIYRDWTQQYETKAKTLRLSADETHPFTHQELFEVCRTNVPFIVADGFGDVVEEVFYFRADGSAWKCERASDSNDAQFHVQYKAVVAGYLTEPT